MAQQPADDGSARRQDDDDDDGINVVAAAAAAAVGPGPAAVAPAGDETAAAARAQMHGEGGSGVDDALHLEAQMQMQAPQPPPSTTPPVMVLDQARNFDDERVDGGLKAWLQVAASFALYFNHLYDPPSSFSLRASLLLLTALPPLSPGLPARQTPPPP